MSSVLEPIATDAGLVAGINLPSGVRAWLGVPFAAPPLRELRWRAPQPVQPWEGVRNVDRFAPMCLQPLRNRRMNHYFGDEATSEDCLYLNIWAPQSDLNDELLPVVVWIYGGSFAIGSASMANYSGEPLAAKGVVRVNLAYRAGTMGFLSHPDLTTEGGGASGNYGLMDQVFALEWIQRNIAAFGGDPNNVTIVGQSAGSYSVAFLQASSMTRGLFHRVIGMSGSPMDGTTRARSLASAERAGVRFQESLNCSNIEQLRDLSGDVVMMQEFSDRMPVAVDGKFLEKSVGETFALGQHNDVPAMLGFTKDEFLWTIGSASSVEEFESRVRAFFPATSAEVLAEYTVTSSDDVTSVKSEIDRDCSLGLQMFSWACAQTSPTYAWLFTRRQPYIDGVTFSDHDPDTVGAYHGSDMPYWLGTLESLNLIRPTREWTDEDRALSERMMDALVAFARGEAPENEWPVFDESNPMLLELGLQSQPQAWPHAQSLHLLRMGQSAPSALPSQHPRD